MRYRDQAGFSKTEQVPKGTGEPQSSPNKDQPSHKGQTPAIQNENAKEQNLAVDKALICHECKRDISKVPLARCKNLECEDRFCYQCIRKYQIDSFIKADFKHMIENPKVCPVCANQCRCSSCKFYQDKGTGT